MSVKWLLLLVRQSRVRWEPFCTSQHCLPRWSGEAGVVHYKGGLVTPFSYIFSLGSSISPSKQCKKENDPCPHGQKAHTHTQICETLGKEVKFLLFITFKSAALRGDAASLLLPFSATKDSISFRAGHVSEGGFKSQTHLSMSNGSLLLPSLLLPPLWGYMPAKPLQQRASLTRHMPCDGMFFTAKSLRDTVVIHINAKM